MGRREASSQTHDRAANHLRIGLVAASSAENPIKKFSVIRLRYMPFLSDTPTRLVPELPV